MLSDSMRTMQVVIDVARPEHNVKPKVSMNGFPCPNNPIPGLRVPRSCLPTLSIEGGPNHAVVYRAEIAGKRTYVIPCYQLGGSRPRSSFRTL